MNQSVKINIGLAGSSESIQEYLPYLKENEHFHIVGNFDTTNERNFEAFYGVSPLKDFVKRTDAIIFCGLKHLHLFDLLAECMRNCKHILFEKFPDLNQTELNTLLKLRTEADTLFYISNVYGNCCVYTTARQSVVKPSFVQHRINIPFHSKFSDLKGIEMLQETIDMVLRCTNSPVAKVQVNKHYIFSKTPDEIKIQIAFNNGSQAEIVLNTVSSEHLNTLTLYQSGKIITADIQDIKVLETRVDTNIENRLPFENENSGTAVTQKMNQFEKKILYFDVIQKDLLNFVDCITNHVSPMVSLEEAIDVGHVMQYFTYSQHESFV